MTTLPILCSEKIRVHPFLKGLKDAQLEALEESAMVVEFAANEIIFREGDPANRFYLILDGTVVLRERGSFPFQVLHGGDVLGWSALFSPYTSHFEAEAVEKTRAIFFYGTWVLDRCEMDHDLGYELMKRMSAVLLDRLQARRRAHAVVAIEGETGNKTRETM